MTQLADGNATKNILGLWPSMAGSGGIQVAGKLAWEAIAERFGGISTERDGHQIGNRPPQSFLFTYGGLALGAKTQRSEFHATSKFEAVTGAIRKQWHVKTVLIWHVGLLKLLPFFRLRDTRWILFLHGIESWKSQDWFTRQLLKRVHLFLSNSDYTWRKFNSLNPDLTSAPHRTIQLGVELPDEYFASRPLDAPAVLMLSRLALSENYKGHREMIEAWPLVLSKIPQAELWIAGSGDLRPVLEKLVAERQLQQNVRFWGWVPEEKKQELLSNCRCLALPSRGEGFGLVYLEAMRVGRPCLISTMDAGREVVNPPEAGLAADPDDSTELAAAVIRLLAPGSEWDQWSAQARRRYERYFTAKHFQERLLAALPAD